jgi:hypothetical protein
MSDETAVRHSLYATTMGLSLKCEQKPGDERLQAKERNVP